MQAGQLDRRVRLLRALTVRDAANAPTPVWRAMPGQPPLGLACSRRRVSGREVFRAQQLGATVTDVFEIRWSQAWADLDPRDELEHEGRRYGVVEVSELGRRQGLQILAVARADLTPREGA